MSYAQWNKDKLASATSSLDLVTPITGTSSLSLDSNVASQAIYLTPTGASGLTKGVEQGRLRTLVKMTTGSGNGCGFGLVCMGGSDTLATVGTSAFIRYELFSNGNYNLYRSNSSGLNSGAPGTPLQANIAQSVVQNTIYGIQMEWIVDVPNLGGVYIITKKGTAIDFSDLIILNQLVDTGAQILTTSASEGIFMRGYTSTGPVKVLFDQTELFQLI